MRPVGTVVLPKTGDPIRRTFLYVVQVETDIHPGDIRECVLHHRESREETTVQVFTFRGGKGERYDFPAFEFGIFHMDYV